MANARPMPAWYWRSHDARADVKLARIPWPGCADPGSLAVFTPGC